MFRISFCFVCVFFVLVKNATAANTGPTHGKAVICYLATYAEHRPGRGSFKLENFNPTLCTHLTYAFALLNETDESIQLLGSWSDLKVNQQDGESNISKLKKVYPHLKVSVALGGWQDGSIKYSNMVADPNKRKSFVNNSVAFLKQQNLDGLDLVWMYPSKRGGRKEDKLNYVELVKDLRTAFDKHNLLLTAFLACSKDTIDYGYDVSQLTKYLDYAILMCYDFHGIWARTTGHSSALYGSGIYNSVYSLNYVMKLGAKPNKLVLAAPLYGRTFITTEPIDLTEELPGLQKRIKNYTFGGPLTEEDDMLGYNEICLELKNTSTQWKTYWDDEAKVPFAINGDKFISYDNPRSMKEKVKFTIDKKLGGMAVWSVDTDDFHGDCHEEIDGEFDYPLLRSINSEFNELVQKEVDNKVESDNKPETDMGVISSSVMSQINSVLMFVTSIILCYCRHFY